MVEKHSASSRTTRHLPLPAARLAAVHAATLWLLRAEQLLEVIVKQFDDPAGGFFDTAADAEQLYARPRTRLTTPPLRSECGCSCAATR